jgi:hypothetical protein
LFKGIQLLGITIGLYLVIMTLIEYRSGKATLKRTLIFTGLWSLMILFFINTRLMYIFMPILSTENNVLTALVIGILIVFILYLDLYKKLNEVERSLSILVQRIALEEHQEDKGKTVEEG